MDSPQEVIQAWTAKLLANPEQAEKMNAVYKFVIEGEGGGTWVLHCKNPVEVTASDGPADCTICVHAKYFVAIAKGELNPQVAFMGGQIRVSGDMSQALKLSSIMGGT
ncbi:SCP2 sterol-binding domain-containing protein [Oligoflexia bacterium]|nr:SCP2 sterol-binding domain-containing protein [Oligoflexia bacterium]